MVGSESVERVGGWFGDEHMLVVMAIQFTHSLCPKEVGEAFFGDILCLFVSSMWEREKGFSRERGDRGVWSSF
jgi:hypothetical protein